MKVKQKLLVKMMLTLLAVMVGAFGTLTFSHINKHKRLLEDVYENRAVSISYAMDANIQDSSDLTEEKLMQGINKHIWLNPDVLVISVDIFDGERLKTIASSDPLKVDQEAGERRGDVFEKNEVNYDTIEINGERVLRTITPVHVSGKNVGTYSVDLSLVKLDKQLEKELIDNLIKYGLVMMFMIVTMYIVSQRLVIKPLRMLSDGMIKVLDKEEEYKIVLHSKDELGKLAQDFNEMAERIRESKHGLEEKVREKTEELAEKMKVLETQSKEQEMTKKAMINLLEDAKELEESLKLEKEGVEKKVEERTAELSKQAKELEESKQRATAGWVDLQAEKAKLSASIGVLPLGLLILDKNHNVIESNKELKRISDMEMMSDFKIGELEKFLKELGLSVKETCAHCGKGETLTYKALKYRGKFLKLISVPVILESKIIATTYLVEDVTETKKLQKTRDEFFSVASHELRTPLTAIRGNTQMLQDYYPEIQNNAEVKEMVTDIHAASVRLIGIVNDFLDASRLELKKTEMKFSQFSLKELVEKTMEQVNPESVGRELEYKLDVSEGMDFTIKADKDRLQQVLINLIGNAFKFTKEGGVYIGIQNGNEGFLKVSITDTGVGMSKADQTELFAKFKQVGSNAGLARDVSEGTGMGLYISKLIMEAEGGRVYLEKSEEGKGSTFVIEVPKAS